jgi:NADH-quinone oxidoreductase subunit J
MVITLLFYFFCGILLVSSMMVIMAQNSIFSVLFLVLSFVSSASLLFLLECEFVALLFIIIYVGAIAVLFLFVVMMLDVKTVASETKNRMKYFPFGALIGTVFLIEILSVAFKNFKVNPYQISVLYNEFSNWYDKLDSLTEIEFLGQILYTHYVLQFLIGGFILFLAVIGAVVLTINFSKQRVNSQIVSKQLSRIYQNSIHY